MVCVQELKKHSLPFRCFTAEKRQGMDMRSPFLNPSGMGGRHAGEIWRKMEGSSAAAEKEMEDIRLNG